MAGGQSISWSIRKARRRGRIELLNGRWRNPRPGARIDRCADCGRDILLDDRVVYRGTDMFHEHCADRLGEAL
jgi:hypothetical protein